MDPQPSLFNLLHDAITAPARTVTVSCKFSIVWSKVFRFRSKPVQFFENFLFFEGNRFSFGQVFYRTTRPVTISGKTVSVLGKNKSFPGKEKRFLEKRKQFCQKY
jgi:hypothetical protein